MLSTHTFAADCAGTWHGTPPASVTGFAIDSRALRPGEAFVALQTERRDGHDFVAAAAAAGAAVALVSRVVPGMSLSQLVVRDPLEALQALARAHRERFSGPVVGVTGSAGKTSTKDLLALLLGESGEVLATAGNLNNHLGVPLTLLRLDPVRHRAAVIEAGISGPGEMDVLARLIQPDVALITTVSAAHLDGLGSVAGVAQEKARLAAHRRAGGIAAFPAACLSYPAFRDVSPPMILALPTAEALEHVPHGCELVRYDTSHGAATTDLRLRWRGEDHVFQLRRTTTGMAGNAVLALATALHLGQSAAALQTRLARWQPAALRGEIRNVSGRLVYLDCYNANPASMTDAVQAFIALAPEPAARLFVIGCMEELGADSAKWHRELGSQWPLRPGDRCIVLGEQAAAFAEGVRATRATAEVMINPSRTDAARLVREAPGPVFLKGSRRHALETLLDSGADPHQDNPHRGEVAA